MIRGLLAIEVVVLVLLMQTNHFLKQKFSSNVNQKQSNHCSKGRSLVVRTVLIQKFYPIIDKFNISLPIDCPFHPLRELDTSNLDRNLVVDDSICLADYCDIIRCDVLIGNEKRKHLSSLKSLSSSNSNSECDKEKLKNLYEKCTNLIRQCTLGTIELDSSMKEFMNLERELSKSICSFFLSCDLYCQNNLDRTRNISIKFLIFLILLMICLFSICYYFVWNLLENDNSYYNELQLSTRIKNVLKVVNLANLVKLVYLVNLCKNKWLCKRVNRIEKENRENDQMNFEQQVDKIDIKEDELIDQKTKLPFKMKQSIFSIRSSSSDSIKKMHLEHLRNLELHEKRIKELEKLNDKKLNEQKIMEDQFGDLENKDDDDLSDNELNKEVYKHLSGRRFTKDGAIEIISTKSDDKESFYEEAENDFRKLSNINNELILVNERKDQRRLSEQSICSNLTCPNRLNTNSPSIKNLSMQNLKFHKTLESIKDETKISKKFENKILENDNNLKKQENIQKNEIQNDKDNDQSNTPRKRLWHIVGDTTLLNSAKLKLLETKRAASRQLNYRMDENNQSNQLCKDLKRKSEIELKEFPQHHLTTTISTKRFEQNNLKSTNLINQTISNQFIDQSKESKKRFLYRQSLSNSRSNSAQKYASNFMIMNSSEDMIQPPPISKKLINPILNQIIFQKTRSQPTSSSQTPVLPSTSSTPYR